MFLFAASFLLVCHCYNAIISLVCHGHYVARCVVSLQAADVQAIIDDIRKLKIIVKGHERRIKSLEEQLAMYDSHQQSEYQ